LTWPPTERIASAADWVEFWIAEIWMAISLGRARGQVRQALHFVGDDREAVARFAGARRLDRRIERQKSSPTTAHALYCEA